VKIQSRFKDTHFIPIKTRRLNPPKDDLWAALRVTDMRLQNGDIVVITSKVIAIDEGRTALKSQFTKDDLIPGEADAYMPRETHRYGFALSIIHHALISSAGIDASNGGDYWTLLPKDPFASAKLWRQRLCAHFGLTDLGVVITDSHCIPMRRGVVDISIGFAGFEPLKDHRGHLDLFGEPLKVTLGNAVDSLAAATGWIMGQADEGTPVVIVRGWPNIVFKDGINSPGDFLIDPDDDVFTDLLDIFKTKGVVKKPSSV
jgi:dihydrofolate synthase / folylpolyglutamate synthase